LGGTLEYNRDLFEEATMTRLLGHLETLLTAVSHNPHQPVATLPLLTPAEQQQQREWNETAVATPLDQPIHHLIEAQVRRSPNQTAVFYEGTSLTFAQLNQRANQLAHCLQKEGLTPDGIVGIYLEPSLEMIVAVLGTLKAGGAYLPLDPTYPAERLAAMLADARPAFVLSHNSLLTSCQKIAPPETAVLNLDADWPTIAREPRTNPDSHATASNLAYIIYTSGSTGQPKGTLLAHRGLCNLAQAYVEKLHIGPQSRLLRFFSFGFDGSVGDISRR
jgi:non-ribosomal peptide synthetase component F